MLVSVSNRTPRALSVRTELSDSSEGANICMCSADHHATTLGFSAGGLRARPGETSTVDDAPWRARWRLGCECAPGLIQSSSAHSERGKYASRRVRARDHRCVPPHKSDRSGGFVLSAREGARPTSPARARSLMATPRGAVSVALARLTHRSYALAYTSTALEMRAGLSLRSAVIWSMSFDDISIARRLCVLTR